MLSPIEIKNFNIKQNWNITRRKISLHSLPKTGASSFPDQIFSFVLHKEHLHFRRKAEN
jgi:hypothetical protein